MSAGTDPTGSADAASRAAILRERARRAASALDDEASVDSIEVLAFRLAAECYAVETRFVREVQPLRGLTPIPCTPPFVLGVINVRGELSAVIQLKRLLGLPEQGLTNATTAIVVRDTEPGPHGGASIEVGLVADVIVGVRRIALADIRPPPPTFSGIGADFLRGLAGDDTAILDTGRMLRHPALIVDERVT